MTPPPLVWFSPSRTNSWSLSWRADAKCAIVLARCLHSRPASQLSAGGSELRTFVFDDHIRRWARWLRVDALGKHFLKSSFEPFAVSRGQVGGAVDMCPVELSFNELASSAKCIECTS